MELWPLTKAPFFSAQFHPSFLLLASRAYHIGMSLPARRNLEADLLETYPSLVP
jgi:hypothetical protein